MKNELRKNRGVHLNRTQRKKVRNKLLKVLGNKCCWCGEPMEVPGPDVKNYHDLATIEHYFAVAMEEPDNIMLFQLAHERCNR